MNQHQFCTEFFTITSCAFGLCLFFPVQEYRPCPSLGCRERRKPARLFLTIALEVAEARQEEPKPTASR